MPVKVGLDTSLRIKKRFPTKVITWLYPDLPGMFDSVTALVERSGGELNFNDALIAISCQQRGIPYLVSFDSDFDRVDKLIRIGSPDDLAAL
ncbi:MAG TPA: PIN domain-containing protein [Anaerolineales bacterium]|nr:PIN domain-containing protein [Anaerolineales bacterium]